MAGMGPIPILSTVTVLSDQQHEIVEPVGSALWNNPAVIPNRVGFVTSQIGVFNPYIVALTLVHTIRKMTYTHTRQQYRDYVIGVKREFRRVSKS